MLSIPSFRSVFGSALGLAEPWVVEEVSFSREAGRLDITVGYPAGSRFPCPQCAVPTSVYDHRRRTWRHLNFFQYETHLHAEVPRIHCVHCAKTVTTGVPWARGGSGFTLLFEAFIVHLAQLMPLLGLERVTGEYDTRLMRTVAWYVAEARARVDMSGVRTVGIDETSRAKGHDYVTVCSDLDANRTLFVTAGKDATTVARFCDDLRVHGGDPEQVTDAVTDLSAAFIAGVRERLPNAQPTFDRFHVAQLVSDALDEVRREEQRTVPALKGTRYALLTNPENASPEQREQVASLPKRHCRTAKAYQLRLALHDTYAIRNRSEAALALQRWYLWATHTRIPQVIRAAKTIKRHWDGVLRYFDRRLTNGQVEARNGIIQTIKRRARGYRNTDHFITMIYLVTGKLPFNLPSLTPTFSTG